MKKFNFINAVLLAFVMTGTAHAALLSDLFNGGSVSSGGFLFDRWSLELQDSSTGVAPDYTNIDINASGGMPDILDFDFNGEMNVTGDDIYAYSDLSVGFWVSPLTATTIDNIALQLDTVSLSFTPNGLEDLGVFIQEDIYDVAGTLLATMDVESSQLFGQGTLNDVAHSTFADQSEIFIVKNILAWSVNTGDVVSLDSFQQSIPEPSTWVLLIIGLLSTSLTRQFSMRR